MLIHCFGGLCNRLRVILSYRAAYGRVDVIWKPNGEIAGGTWADMFWSLPGVRFDPWDCGALKWACETLDVCPDAPANWRLAYRELTLLPELRDRLQAIPRPYSAMHVRRTDLGDNLDAKRNPTHDDEFHEWLLTARGPVWLATDNGTTQQKYAEEIASLGHQPMYSMPIPIHADEDKGGQRNTPLWAAAVDLFACAGSAAFMGTRESSFSDTAESLRQLGGWWST